MVLRANSPQKVNALACNTRRFGLILCFLLASRGDVFHESTSVITTTRS